MPSTVHRPPYHPAVNAERARATFPAEHKQFRHSSVNVGSVLRSTGRMVLAGWIIEKLALKDSMHRTLAYAAAGIAMGYAEKLLQDRKEQRAR